MNPNLNQRPVTAWQLIRIYWQSEQRVSAYLLLISVAVLSLLIVGINVLLTTWYNHFYNALQEYNLLAVKQLLWVFTFLAAVFIIMSVYSNFIQSYLTLRWRKWLTQQFLSRWLGTRGYYYLENFDRQTDNPDQRIQEDIGSLVTLTLDLMLGLLTSVVTIISFVFVLWKLSGVITIPLGKLGTLHIPGYLVWVSIIYATIGSILAFKIGRPLVALNFEQQRREANFRYAAIALRTHAENVALYRGEKQQENLLDKLLGRLLDNWYMIILRQKLLGWFTSGYNQVSVLVPLAVALPNYFNKVFELGGLMQSIAAFARIQEALSFLVNSYTRIAEWQAIMQRLLTFLNHLSQVEDDAVRQNKIVLKPSEPDRIHVKDLTICTPSGESLLANINQEFIQGKNYLIKGMSGIGKSTFIRTLAGIWPYGSGEIDIPEKKSMMFLPQRFYMPIGTLKEALMFPENSSSVAEEELIKLLKECGLEKLKNQLNETKPWTESLSPGELQRVAFVRVMLQKPDWVFLDESTSSLDLDHEKQLYDLLKKKLPRSSLVSVGHRPSLAEYHDDQIDIAQYKAQPVLA